MHIEILDFLNDRKRRGMSPRTIEWHRQVLGWFEEWALGQGVTAVEQGEVNEEARLHRGTHGIQSPLA